MKEEEKLRIAVKRSAELLVANGLGDWKLKLNNKRSALAETWHSDKSITISKHFIIISDEEQLEGVVYHEIAHALLGPGYGHGKEFVSMCTKISPNQKYARRGVDVPIRKFIMTCPECGYSGTLNVNKELYCGVCAKENKMIKFEVTENKLEVKEW